MNEQIEKLKKKIEEIEALKREPNWGADFQLWLNLTEKLVEQIFGSEGLKLFKQQQSAILSNEGYFRELNSRKKILEGLLANKDEYSPEMAKKENHKKWNKEFSDTWKDLSAKHSGNQEIIKTELFKNTEGLKEKLERVTVTLCG